MALDAAKKICDIGLTCWDRVAKYRKYIRSLRDNLNALKSKVDDLVRVYDDVNQRVRAAEGEGWARTSDVDGWLQKVESLKREAGEILDDGEKIVERKCLCGLCFCNCRPRYKQSWLAKDKKDEVEHELTRGRSFGRKEDVVYEPADLSLKRSVEALWDKMGELQDVFETVKQRVEREEKMYMVRTSEVGGWLNRVEDLLGKEALEVLKEGELEMGKSRQSRAQGDSQCQRNPPLYHSIAKRVDEKSAILEQKLVQGRGLTVFTGKPIDPVMLEIPSESPVGAESMFKEIWNWVEDEKVRCIGIFGMGGVGKTTLLNRVHNQLCQVRHDYNLALQIVVSRKVNLDQIQENVLEQIKLPEQERRKLDRIGRASLVHDKMKEKNFLLFLDDVWDPIDLVNDIGIPFPGHSKKCKIVFTTREEGVCNRMHPDKKKKVECLPPDEALQLFRQKLGEETWGAHPLIPEIATSLVHECKYLPVALVTVAGAMVGTTELKYWMDAQKYLKSHLSKFSNMNERVLANLEFSYRNLPDETHRLCFLYLSVFPEDHEIDEDDAINLWIGEGFLDECRGVHDARNYGGQIFRRLRHACLVELVRHSRKREDIVKMHDMIHEMALWVDSEHGLETDRVLVRENPVSSSSEEVKKREKAKRISLWGRSCDSLANISCSNISTLVIRGTGLRTIPDDFFLSTPCLRVLDLSGNNYLSNIPKSIWKVVNLRYLNLNFFDRKMGGLVTRTILPVEIKNLNKLVVLILSANCQFPDDVLSSLSSLRVLCWSDATMPHRRSRDQETELLEELQLMQSMEELSMTLCWDRGVKTLLHCTNLLGYLRRLSLAGINGLNSFRISTSSLRGLEHLSSLTLYSCDMRQVEITDEDKDSHRYSYVESLAPQGSSLASLDIFSSLRDVRIERCNNLLDVTSLICHAPILKFLCISYCSSLKEVIVSDVETKDTANSRIFPCLEYLHLSDLASLERICSRALPFPSLKEISVRRCRKLKELPLNCESAKTLELIKGGEVWWQRLEWDDAATKQVFSTKFVRSFNWTYACQAP